MTRLRFSGGEVIQVALSVDEVQDLIQQALTTKSLLRLEAGDGRQVVINPQQVLYLQDANVRVEYHDGVPQPV